MNMRFIKKTTMREQYYSYMVVLLLSRLRVVNLNLLAMAKSQGKANPVLLGQIAMELLQKE